MNGCQRIVHPESLEEALVLLSTAPEQYTPCAGGTDIFAAARAKPNYTVGENLLSIGRLPQLRDINWDGTWLHVGAACTFAQLLEDPLVEAQAPLLAAASQQVASPQIRNMATIGGNVCNASPAADGLTALSALEAQCVLSRWQAGIVAKRIIPLSQLVSGPGHTQREPAELLTEFLLPGYAGCPYGYEKVGLRSALAIALLSLAVVVDRRQGLRLHVALGSLGPRTVVSRQAEQLAEVGELNAATAAWLAAISPIDDLRSSAVYRRKAAENLLRRQVALLLKEEY